MTVLIALAVLLLGTALYLARTKEDRSALGLIFAPLTAPILLTLVTRDRFALLLTAAFAYPLGLLFGIPGFFLLRRLNKLRLGWIVFLSSIFGFLAGLLLETSGPYSATILSRLLFYGGLGALTGLVFWLIAFARLRSNNAWSGRDA